MAEGMTQDAPPADREWQNAENDDFDRREARDSEMELEREPSVRDRERDDERERDGDRRRPPPRDRWERRPPRDTYDRRPYDRAPRRRDDRYPPGGARGAAEAARPSPAPSNIIGAFGLSIRTTERDLEEEFGRVGEVEKVVIVYDARTGRSRGFGFLTMKDVESATEAIQQMNGVELHGRRIRVDYSSTSRAHDPTPGEYRGNPRPADDRYAPPRHPGSSYRGAAYRGDRDRDEGRDYGRDYGRDRDRDRDYRDRDYGRDSYGRRDRGRYDDADRAGSWARRDDRGPRYRRGHGPDSDDWRRRASPPRARSRSPPPRARYDGEDERRGAPPSRAEDDEAMRYERDRYADERPARYD